MVPQCFLNAASLQPLEFFSHPKRWAITPTLKMTDLKFKKRKRKIIKNLNCWYFGGD